jgi:hypothetical protein
MFDRIHSTGIAMSLNEITPIPAGIRSKIQSVKKLPFLPQLTILADAYPNAICRAQP